MESFSFILHLDEHLANIVSQFGTATYAILFLIIFAETGLVIAPFLPGDSLLFAVGTLAAKDIINIWFIYILFLVAAILGDTVNYWIGHKMGAKAFSQKNSRIFNRKYLDKTEKFYEKYGGKTIILARFLPIIRTFAPFVAGVGNMHYRTFIFYNVVGAFVWVTFFTWAGYLFGGIKIIKENFELAVVGIVIFSLVPIVYEYLNHKRKLRKPQATYKDLKKTFKKEHLND